MSGFPEAIEGVFGDTWVQCCVVHLIRNSLKFVSYKDRREVVVDLRPIYQAPTEDAAADALGASAGTVSWRGLLTSIYAGQRWFPARRLRRPARWLRRRRCRAGRDPICPR